MARRLAAATVAAALAVAGCGGHSPRTAAPRAAAPPAPSPTATPTPGRADLAEELTSLHRILAAAVDAWLRDGDPAAGPAPDAVARPAARQFAIYRRLASRPRLAKTILGRLRDRATRAEAVDVLAAQRALRVLNAPFAHAPHHPKLRVGAPEPAGRLLTHYREARARSGIAVPLLAAVNLVESSFGRLRNDSVAGAQGPMQFMPATWATYGRGGDVHDARDAILGAARLLRAGGAPADERAALLRYNPSPLYVTAVERYAAVIRRDPRAYWVLYAWPAPVPQTVRP